MLCLVMGVCGSGKSTIAQLLAANTSARYLDADDFHPESNKTKMAAGVALTDADREPWLEALHHELLRAEQRQQSVVLACSALKQRYRERLAQGLPVQVVYLDGSRELLQQRLNQRQSHFMNPNLLDSQLATLEKPEPQRSLWLDLQHSPQVLVQQIRDWLLRF